jgi:hypothetical protein
MWVLPVRISSAISRTCLNHCSCVGLSSVLGPLLSNRRPAGTWLITTVLVRRLSSPPVFEKTLISVHSFRLLFSTNTATLQEIKGQAQVQHASITHRLLPPCPTLSATARPFRLLLAAFDNTVAASAFRGVNSSK